jgi:hypothetical protein
MTPYFKMALGEVVGEARGKITAMRVLPDGKIEVSQQGTGKLLGSEISDAATYWTVMGPNGTAYGERQQAIMSGDGSAIWKGSELESRQDRAAAGSMLLQVPFRLLHLRSGDVCSMFILL